MLWNICAQHIDHLQCSPPVYRERPEQTGDVEVVTDEEKIQQLVKTELTMMNALHQFDQMTSETVGQTSLTCFHVSADANQMIEFEDEIQSNQLRLHLDPCYGTHKNTLQLKTS